MFLQRVRPHQAVRSGIARGRRVNTLEPGFVFAPPNIAAARDIDAAAVENRHAIEVAGAFAPIAVVVVNIGFRRTRIKIEMPDGA